MLPERIFLASKADWVNTTQDRLPFSVTPFSILGKNHKVVIAPAIHHGRNVLVLGHDWLPVTQGGATTLAGMVHTPSIYAPKIRNLVTDNGQHWRPAFRSHFRISHPAVLIGGSRNYYHWLVNHLPRLFWLKQLALLGDRKILVNDRLTHFQTESLSHIGIDAADLVQVADDEAVLCDDLLIPDFFAADTVTHPLAVTWLRSAYLHGAKAPGDKSQTRIYLSRADAVSRRLLNEAAILNTVARHGFKPITTGLMPFLEQVGAYAQSNCVVATHGAGMTNILFSPLGSQIVEIASPSHRVSSMQMLSYVCGHDHHFTPATPPYPSQEVNPLLRDWVVDEAMFDTTLKEALEALD